MVAGQLAFSAVGSAGEETEIVVVSAYGTPSLKSPKGLARMGRSRTSKDRFFGRSALLDRALLIVTADHGVAFTAGAPGRAPAPESYPEILFVPLFVKLPGQSRGAVSDVNAQAQDVLPTIAEALGVEIPWEIHGRPLHSLSPAAPSVKSFYSRHSRRRRYDLAAAVAALEKLTARNRDRFDLADPARSLFRFGPRRDAVGRRVSEFARRSGGPAAKIHGQQDFRRVDLAGPVLPTRVTGELAGVGADANVWVAIAVNGVVRATTRSYRSGEVRRFDTYVPEPELVDGSNRVEVFAVGRSHDGGLVLRVP